jgi:hypothetical protein
MNRQTKIIAKEIVQQVIEEQRKLFVSQSSLTSRKLLDDDNIQREIKGVSEAVSYFNLSNGLILTYNTTDELIYNNKQIIVKPLWEWLFESTNC